MSTTYSGPGKPKELTGQRFGRLTAMRVARSTPLGRIWVCQCDCGKYIETRTRSLTSGHTKSCGCLVKDIIVARQTTHGWTKHPLHYAWVSMRHRCLNSSDPNYHNYGGRGISICQEWIDDCSAFVTWGMANGWKRGLQIDRRDNDKGYSPVNCRFVTGKENSRNTRNTLRLTYNEETLPAIALFEKYAHPSIARNTFYGRLTRGWDIEKALQTPSPKWRISA